RGICSYHHGLLEFLAFEEAYLSLMRRRRVAAELPPDEVLQFLCRETARLEALPSPSCPRPISQPSATTSFAALQTPFCLSRMLPWPPPGRDQKQTDPRRASPGPQEI